jgi:nitroreductase
MNKIVNLFCIASLFAMLFSCSQSEQKTTESEKSVPSFDEVIKTRRSVRSYDSTKTITQEQVKELLISTQEAPSWANQQPTKYYVAITPEKVKAVAELTGPTKEKIAGAPVVIVSTYERGKSGFFQGNQTNEIGDGWGAYDNGLSNAYLIIKARAMGFDTLIMGLRDAKELRSLLSIPNEETVMAVISLGYRAEEPKQPQHRPLEEIVRFY